MTNIREILRAFDSCVVLGEASLKIRQEKWGKFPIRLFQPKNKQPQRYYVLNFFTNSDKIVIKCPSFAQNWLN